MSPPALRTAARSVFLCGVLLAHPGLAQERPAYPSKPVRIVMGVPPGGQADQLARGIAQELTKKWGQAVLIENRPGASGIPATDAVVRSAPDGHTIFTTDSVQFITNQLLRKLPYDPVKDLAPVAAVARTSAVLVASLKSSINSLNELLERARARPGALNYGSFGIGSSFHLNVEALSAMTGIKVTHVPYKGGPEITNALLAGDLDFALIGTASAMGHIRQGKLKVLGASGRERSSRMPDVPAISETVKGYDGQGWYGWFVPSSTPRAVIERISADVGEILPRPAFSEKFIWGIGLEPLYLPPTPFAETLAADREKYATLIRSLNLKLE